MFLRHQMNRDVCYYRSVKIKGEIIRCRQLMPIRAIHQRKMGHPNPYQKGWTYPDCLNGRQLNSVSDDRQSVRLSLVPAVNHDETSWLMVSQGRTSACHP